MIDYYILSTNLHLFQAYHISKSQPERKSIFIIEESISCLFANELHGRKIYFARNDSYIKAIKSSLFVKARKHKTRRVFFGNQVHSLVSVVLSKYSLEEIYVLDDGLQYYGKGVEQKTISWKIKNSIRDAINEALSSASTKLVSTRNYLNFKGISPRPILISILGSQLAAPPNNRIKTIDFTNFFNSARHHEISEKFFKRKERFAFLSYTESQKTNIPQESEKQDTEDVQVIPHPKFRKKKYECPFEFAWHENLSSIDPNTSLYYVLEFISSNDHKSS